MVVYPYFLFIEVLAPVVEASGFLATIVGLSLGAINWHFAILFLLGAYGYGLVLTTFPWSSKKRATCATIKLKTGSCLVSGCCWKTLVTGSQACSGACEAWSGVCVGRRSEELCKGRALEVPRAPP